MVLSKRFNNIRRRAVFWAILFFLPLSLATSSGAAAFGAYEQLQWPWYVASSSSTGGSVIGRGSCQSALLPTINDAAGVGQAINQYIETVDGGQWKSAPLNGLGQQIVDGAIAQGINPFLVVTIAYVESKFGTIPAAQNVATTFNAFGRTAAAGQPQVPYGGYDWYVWSSWEDSVNGPESEAKFLKDNYVNAGLTELLPLISKYAPGAVGNDPVGYAKTLDAQIQKLVDLAGSAISCGVVGIGASNFVFYSQFDSTWTNNPYGSHGTIGSSGCGPATMAMIIATMADQTVTPATIAADFGQYHGAKGSDWSLFGAVASKYGLKAQDIGADLNRAAQAIQNGYLVVATGTGSGPHPFTPNGHILVLRALDDSGDFLLGDPNTTVPPAQDPENSTAYSVGTLISSGLKNMWIISP